jgi:hypothetical protein
VVIYFSALACHCGEGLDLYATILNPIYIGSNRGEGEGSNRIAANLYVAGNSNLSQFSRQKQLGAAIYFTVFRKGILFYLKRFLGFMNAIL